MNCSSSEYFVLPHFCSFFMAKGKKCLVKHSSRKRPASRRLLWVLIGYRVSDGHAYLISTFTLHHHQVFVHWKDEDWIIKKVLMGFDVQRQREAR